MFMHRAPYIYCMCFGTVSKVTVILHCMQNTWRPCTLTPDPCALVDLRSTAARLCYHPITPPGWYAFSRSSGFCFWCYLGKPYRKAHVQREVSTMLVHE